MKHAILVSLPVFASMLAAQPSIDSGGVLNVSSAQPVLAPNAVFVIYGKNLGPATIVIASPPNYPTTLANTSVTFTSVGGGAGINAYMYYTLAGAVTGVLPSSIPPGTYAVRVTYNGQTSNAQNVTVVARHFGIATSNGVGTGVAQATIANVNQGFSISRFTTSGTGGPGNFVNTPVHPGETISLWGTGGGADLLNDTGGTAGDQTAAGNFKVMVGSRVITPTYTAAVAGYPGLWVLIFALPVDIDPDCYASLQVSANGELSNVVTLPIAVIGQSVCYDPQLSGASLAKLDAGGSITGGAFSVYKVASSPTNTVSEGSSGGVFRWTAAQWAAGGASRSIRVGSCYVYDRTYPQSGTDPASQSANLDAGASLSLSGPNLAGATLGKIAFPLGPFYALTSPPGTIASGKYTLTGNGGTQVGPFTASATFPSSFVATNFESINTVSRSQPLVLTWTSSGADLVYILVGTNTVTGGNVRSVTIGCIAQAAPGTFTIPASQLSQLQPASTTGTSFGSLSIQGTSNPNYFTADLAGGGTLDFGVFSPNLGVSKNVAVQ
ncbi:MAG TPA: hypothetical protein VLN48_17075 [Bryobacteraceae bacterium]|nr:hypothetical protein [Bryobacteraceae bacterium]